MDTNRNEVKKYFRNTLIAICEYKRRASKFVLIQKLKLSKIHIIICEK